MFDFKKFNETLSSKNKFYSLLSGKGIREYRNFYIYIYVYIYIYIYIRIRGIYMYLFFIWNGFEFKAQSSNSGKIFLKSIALDYHVCHVSWPNELQFTRFLY